MKPGLWKTVYLSLAVILVAGLAYGAPELGPESKPLEWPRKYTAEDGALLTLFQPQLTHWENHERLEGRAAVAVEFPGEEDQVFGILKLAAKTEVSIPDRLVRISELELMEAKFPALPEAGKGGDPAAILDELFPEEMVVSLDRILADLERAGVIENPPEIKAEPPPIFVSTSPAVLVLIDGEPILGDIEKSTLQFVINTNWNLFHDSKSSRFFLLFEDSWLEAGTLDGRWQAVEKLPKAFKKLPKNDSNFAEVRAAVPGDRLAPSEVPAVFVSQQPAELIGIEGQPQIQPIGETGLLWVTNTESDLFVHEGRYYYLVAGRWFRAEELDGDWVFASESLPKSFLEIPEGHPRARVLPSVPGSPEAEEAIIQAQIPQKATVTRDEVTAPDVVYYAGEPRFEPVEGTSLMRAANTQFDVILASEHYYLCYEGVWFSSENPQGPWSVADTIPAEVYTIPASSPAHSVTYVQVYESTPTTVTYGYTSGYWGVYYGWGTMVYGSGWYWSPYYYYGRYYPYPIYYPYPTTYGVGAWYNPNTGTYGRGAVAYGPYGGMGRAAAYNPQTGTYARGATAWGPYNARGWAEAYNPTTGTYAQTRQGANVYGSWGTTGVVRGDDWVRTGHYTDDRGSVARYQTSEGGSGFVGHNNDNLYAGRDGNVYRRDESGWHKYDDGAWNPVDRPDSDRSRDTVNRGISDPSALPSSRGERAGAAGMDRSTLGQLDRDSYNRQRGTANTDRYRDWNRGGGYGGRGAGAYRGYRGGGGRR